MAEGAQLGRGAAEEQAHGPVGHDPQRAGRCPAWRPGGRCAPRTRPGSRAGGCPASWPPPCAGPCPRTRRACGSGTCAACLPASAAATLSATTRPWRSACWAVGGEALALVAGSGTAAASPMAHTFSRPGTRMVSRRPGCGRARSSGRPRLAHHRRGLDARRPAHECGWARPRRWTARAVSLARPRRAACRCGSPCPRPRSSRVANSASSAGISCITRSVGLDQDPAGAVEAAARVAVDHVGHVVLELGDALQPGVAGAHEHEGQVLAPLLGVVDAPRRSPGAGSRGCAARWRRPGVLKPRPCSARPGIGSTRETEPSATISWS